MSSSSTTNNPVVVLGNVGTKHACFLISTDASTADPLTYLFEVRCPDIYWKYRDSETGDISYCDYIQGVVKIDRVKTVTIHKLLEGRVHEIRWFDYYKNDDTGEMRKILITRHTFSTIPPRRIAFASCDFMDADTKNSLWNNVAAYRPDLMYHIGDNIYGDAAFKTSVKMNVMEFNSGGCRLLYETEYRRTWHRWSNTLMDTSHRFIMDDHDITDGSHCSSFNRRTRQYQVQVVARKVYEAHDPTNKLHNDNNMLSPVYEKFYQDGRLQEDELGVRWEKIGTDTVIITFPRFANNGQCYNSDFLTTISKVLEYEGEYDYATGRHKYVSGSNPYYLYEADVLPEEIDVDSNEESTSTSTSTSIIDEQIEGSSQRDANTDSDVIARSVSGTVDIRGDLESICSTLTGEVIAEKYEHPNPITKMILVFSSAPVPRPDGITLRVYNSTFGGDGLWQNDHLYALYNHIFTHMRHRDNQLKVAVVGGDIHIGAHAIVSRDEQSFDVYITSPITNQPTYIETMYARGLTKMTDLGNINLSITACAVRNYLQFDLETMEGVLIYSDEKSPRSIGRTLRSLVSFF